MDLVTSIIEFESGELGEWETLELFSYLISSGTAWSLQGSYGRFAAHLIELGLLDKKGELLVSDLDEAYQLVKGE